MRRALRNNIALLLAVAAASAVPPAFAPAHAASRHDHAGQPSAAETRQKLQETERQRQKSLAAQQAAAARAAAAAAAAKKLADQRVTTAAKLQQAEAALDAAAQKMHSLAARRAPAEKRLAARAADLTPLLPVIERLSLFPAETLLAVPGKPDDVLRGVLVLRGISTELEQQARALRTEQAEVNHLTAEMQAALPALQQAEATQQADAAALDQQIADAKSVEQQAEDAAAAAAQAAAAQAARADTLRGVLADIEKARKAAEAKARAAAAQAARQRKAAEADAAKRTEEALAQPAGPGLKGAGQATAPVAGRVVHGFGEHTDAGPANGISYAAAPNARVVAPCKGKVVFAAPFRSYGQLLILNCGGGYHFVLAGMQRLDVEVGHPVQPGEPVGVMPGWNPGAPGPRPLLYVELRHGGEPVNPAPWLKGKG